MRVREAIARFLWRWQIPVDLAIGEVFDYTDWERHKSLEWLRQRGASALEMSAGPQGNGRFEKVGELLLAHVLGREALH